jgi:hypothetical protein
VRSYPYLAAKPSQVGVDADRISCPLCCPTACGCRPDALSLWFRKVLPCLVAKPSFGAVAALMGPHVVTVRLGPRAPGPMPPGLITPCGVVLSLHQAFPGGEGSSPQGGVPSMHVEGENTLSPDLKGIGVPSLGTF